MSRAELLRHGPLRALLGAEVISMTGTQMTWLALPWFVLTTTGSPARMTLVMAAELLGFAVAGLPSGTLIQRLGARRTMLLSDAVRAPLMLLVPVLHWSGHLTFPPLVLLALLLGVFGAPYFTSQKVIVPEMLGEDEATVSKASALFQGAIRTTMLLGPAIGGVLIGLFGAANVLVVDAGWQAFFAAVPVLTVERFGADAKVAGALFAAFGAGAVCGNVLSFRFLAERVPGLRLIALCVPFQAMPLWVLPLDVGAFVLFVAVLASGIANGICNPAIRAKAMAAGGTLWALGVPLGLLVAGPVLTAFGARPLRLGFAAVQTVCMLGVAVASLNAREPEPALATS